MIDIFILRNYRFSVYNIKIDTIELP